MNVLCDRHHAGLWRSLQLLAGRLGWTLWTPTGSAWWNEGVWNFGRSTYGDDRLARQFLGATGPDEEFPDVPVNYITLDDARSMPWAYVIASVPDNQGGFAQFAAEAGATYVVQCGNTGQYIDWSLDPIVLNSSEMPLLGRGITYHQELDPVFDIAKSTRDVLPDPTVIRSFVHLMNETHAFPIWNEMRALLDTAALTDEWGQHPYHFIRHGHEPPALDPTWSGNVKPIRRIFDLMLRSGWGFHDKPVGDGFGHVIHGWAASGRPLVGHASHYAGKLGAVFWQDGITAIDLDRHSVPEAVELIREITGTDRHREMGRAMRAVYDRIDYDAEARAIRELLEG